MPRQVCESQLREIVVTMRLVNAGVEKLTNKDMIRVRGGVCRGPHATKWA